MHDAVKLPIPQDLLFEDGKGREVVLPYNSGKKIQGLAALSKAAFQRTRPNP